MFGNDHGVHPRQSFEDILLSDSLRDLNAASLTTTKFDLDLDQLTDSSLDLPDSEWDMVAQSKVLFNPTSGLNAKPNPLSFLQLSPPPLQFETLPETKIVSGPASVQQLKRSSSFFQSASFHPQPMPPALRHPAQYNPEKPTTVVQTKLVSSEYGQVSAPHDDLAAAAAVNVKTGLAPTSATVASTDQGQQDHIVNSLSVSQMLAIASAYDYACQAEDLEVGCVNWLASEPTASEAEIRAVRALFHSERWNFAKDIVMRVVKIVNDLRSAVSDIPGPPSNVSKHAIGRTKKRASPKFRYNPLTFAMEILPTADENVKKRRLWS